MKDPYIGFPFTFLWLWWFRDSLRSLGVRRFHSLDILLADHFVLYDWPGVVFTHNAPCHLLNTAGGLPRLINVLGGELLQHGQVLPTKDDSVQNYNIFNQWFFYSIKLTNLEDLLDVVSVFVGFLAERDGGVDRKYWWKKALADSHSQLPAFRAQSPSSSSSSNTWGEDARQPLMINNNNICWMSMVMYNNHLS